MNTKPRLGTHALPAVLATFAISSCIADGDNTRDPTLSAVASSGAGSSAAGAGDSEDGGFAGELGDGASGAAGRTMPERGGTSGTGVGGSGTAHAGEAGNTSGSAGAPAHGGQSGAGASGGAPSDGGEDSGGETQGDSGGNGGGDGATGPLVICKRLPTQEREANVYAVTDGYWRATTADCRISWISRLYTVNELPTFLNGLQRWNRAFWGCDGTVPPENFGLMYTEVPITAGDAEVIIGIYIDLAETYLEMSSDEIEAMRFHLDRLAARVIESDSDELSNSTCADTSSDDGGEP